MNPGPELDAAIAEKVMGEKLPKPYSTSISAAWEVVGKLRELGYAVHIIHDGYNEYLVKVALFHMVGQAFLPVFYTIEDTAPHAICLAALKAVGVEPKVQKETVDGTH